MIKEQEAYDYHGKHTFNSFVYTYKTAKECLLRAQEKAEGSFYLYLSCLTFCWFTVEAYINHIGINYFNAWKEDERINIDEKIKRLKKYSIDIDKGSSIYQRLCKLGELRDKIAHGKTKTVKYTAENVKSIQNQNNKVEIDFWGVSINEKKCINSINDVEIFIKSLHKRVDSEGNPFLSLGGGSGVRILRTS
jgi:hypothetical protein